MRCAGALSRREITSSHFDSSLFSSCWRSCCWARQVRERAEDELGTEGDGTGEEDQPPAEGHLPPHGTSSERTYPTPRIVWISFVGKASSTFPRSDRMQTSMTLLKLSK